MGTVVRFGCKQQRVERTYSVRTTLVVATSLLALALAGCQANRRSLNLALQNCTPTRDGATVEANCVQPDAAATTASIAAPAAAATPPAIATPPRAPAAAAPAQTRASLILPPALRAQQGDASPAAVAQPSPALQARQTDVATTGSLPRGAATTPVPRRTVTKLTDAVATAVMDYPEIGINRARVREAAAGINIAKSGFLPSADLRLAAGENYSGSFEGRPIPYKTSTNAVDARFDGGLILRQLIYDFGATRSDVERAAYQRDAETMRLREKIDEIAHKTAQTYLRILEQRSLLALVDETIAAHQQLAKIVQAHAQEGHGTIADVQRVNSRLVDVRAIRSDVSLQLAAAEDQFERLTRGRAGKLEAAPNLQAAIPSGAEPAIQRMLLNNPRLAALQATRRSTQKEIEFQQSSMLPKINLEVETESKNYRNGQLGRTQVEGRAMMAMRYRLMDGGLSRASNEQTRARLEGQEMTYLNEREQFEADIRQAYRAIDSARRKEKLIGEGVASAKRVRELYMEQFKGGKRTIFELLDGQMSYYTARRSQIEGQFEGRRAVFDILRATGELTLHLSRKG